MLLEQVIPAIRDGLRDPEPDRIAASSRPAGSASPRWIMRIGDYFREMRNPTMGVLAHMGEIHVRLTCKGQDPAEIAAAARRPGEKMRERLGHLVFGRDDEKFEAVVGRLLRERKATLALAESCTGGLVASRLTDIPGSSDYVERGIVAYSIPAKRDLLRVPGDLIERSGVVSLDVARAMAVGIRWNARTTFGLATTGIAGPTGGTPEKPVGLVCVGLAWDGGSGGREFRLLGDREQIKYRASQMTLEMLRRHLLGIPWMRSNDLPRLDCGFAHWAATLRGAAVPLVDRQSRIGNPHAVRDASLCGRPYSGGDPRGPGVTPRAVAPRPG